MKSITYIGMDVHTTHYTLCCYSVEDDRFFAEIEVKPDYQEVLKYINRVKSQRGKEAEILCGYEAGCLGYSLYHQLMYHGVECVILAPSTMPVTPGKKIKTDRMDARRISKCLAYHTYSAVYVPTAEDDAVKEYIRMRDDGNNTLKRIKQQTIALCTRHGKQYDGKSYWTKRHLYWLEGLDFGNGVLNEVLKEYLVLYYQAQEKVETYDKRIEELSRSETYREPVEKLGCFIGIKNHTALAFCCEVGDFRRFPSAQQFASYLGLVPGENSSGEKQQHTGITKAGNSHLRRLLIEAAQQYGRGAVGKKSAALKARQAGCPTQIVAYADKANERLRRKFYRIALRSKRNIAKTAVARELACFIWGMMTEHYA